MACGFRVYVVFHSGYRFPVLRVRGVMQTALPRFGCYFPPCNIKTAVLKRTAALMGTPSVASCYCNVAPNPNSSIAAMMASALRFSPEQVTELKVTSSTVTPGNWRKASLIRPPQPFGHFMPVTSKVTCVTAEAALVGASPELPAPSEMVSADWHPKVSGNAMAANCQSFITSPFASRNE